MAWRSAGGCASSRSPRSPPAPVPRKSRNSNRSTARGNSGAYSASKFALCGWSDALYLEEAEHGVHVGVVLPGFVATEGFPQQELRDRAATRWLVSRPEKVADAIVDVGFGRKPERFVPRPYWIFSAMRAVAPRPLRRVLRGGGTTMTPATGADAADTAGSGQA